MVFLSLCVAGSALFYIYNYEKWGTAFAFLFLVLAFCWGYFYFEAVKKVKFIKNECKNQLTLEITKNCGCSKQYSLMIENAYLFCQRNIMLLNTLKNASEIDLDNSNIKNIPINLISKYEIFPSFKRSDNEIQLEINDFLGQKNYENNIYDEINKYNSFYNKNYVEDKRKIYDVYMKINEYFYTFFYSDSSVDDRTDFIYSTDFERLFIGEISKGKYKKTLLINLNEVKSFEMFETIKRVSKKKQIIWAI